MTAAPSTQPGLVLVAHGSRDPRAEQTVGELTARVSERLPGVAVRAAYLDHSEPTPLRVLLDLDAHGVRPVRLVPLLFAPGFHVRVDLPAVIEAARSTAPSLLVEVSQTLAEPRPDPAGVELLLDALDRRLGSTRREPAALVLAAAGSSDADARGVIHELADRWGARHGLPAVASFASGPGARPDAAAAAVGVEHAVPLHRVAVGLLFLAEGHLPGRAASAAAAVGAVVTPVLGPAPELVDLLVLRYSQHQLDGLALRG